jgi:hypothetical protein
MAHSRWIFRDRIRRTRREGEHKMSAIKTMQQMTDTVESLKRRIKYLEDINFALRMERKQPKKVAKLHLENINNIAGMCNKYFA